MLLPVVALVHHLRATLRVRPPDELNLYGRCFEIAGPEGPGRSDVDDQQPAKIHPSMDEWSDIDYSA
ncbi:hypothetical protein [Streptomyces sp. NPDC002403]